MDVDARLDRIETEIAGMKKEMVEVKIPLGQFGQLPPRIDGRLDERRATLSALIPQRLAAVPPAA